MIDVGLNEFGEKFNLAVLDSMGSEREGAKKSVLKVSKKIADYSSQNLKTNTDGYLASVPLHSIVAWWKTHSEWQVCIILLGC